MPGQARLRRPSKILLGIVSGILGLMRSSCCQQRLAASKALATSSESRFDIHASKNMFHTNLSARSLPLAVGACEHGVVVVHSE